MISLQPGLVQRHVSLQAHDLDRLGQGPLVESPENILVRLAQLLPRGRIGDQSIEVRLRYEQLPLRKMSLAYVVRVEKLEQLSSYLPGVQRAPMLGGLHLKFPGNHVRFKDLILVAVVLVLNEPGVHFAVVALLGLAQRCPRLRITDQIAQVGLG